MKIVIIGAGPGGYETALEARKKGFEVTLIEEGQVGGTCLNAGCIPTKAYCRSAEVAEVTGKAREFGVLTGNGSGNFQGNTGQDGEMREAWRVRVDFAAVKKRKDGIVRQLRENVEMMLENARVELVRGRAVFRDARTLAVGNDEISADWIIVATGSGPAFPGIPGLRLPGVTDSSGLLDCETLPGRLCIIGGGVIGLEFASVFNSFGSEVTVVETCREILPRFDGDIARRLRQSLSKKGVDFRLQSSVESVEKTTSGALKVNLLRKGVKETSEADNVLVATGRKPRTEGIGLEKAGVLTDGRGAVLTDADMRTNVPWIFAIGDANGRQQLAHAAVFQGKTALQAIIEGLQPDFAGNKAGEDGTGINLSVMPSAVFTMPEVASVGLTEEECREKSLEFTARKSFFRAVGKAVCIGETDGLCKMLTAPDGTILGCHIIGPHASDTVQEVAALMTAGAAFRTLKSTVRIHPGLSEIFMAL